MSPRDLTTALLALALIAGCESKVLDIPDADDVEMGIEDTAAVDEDTTEADAIPDMDTGCPPTAGCLEPGTRCVDESLVTCAYDPFGCLFLTADHCPIGAVCVQDAEGAACVEDDPCAGISDCDEDSAECDGEVALVCAPNEDGCLVRSFENCKDTGGVCKDGACTLDPCEDVENPCAAAGPTCDGNTLAECVADEFGCLSLSEPVDCGETSGGFCSPGPPASCKGEIIGNWLFVRVADLATPGPGGAPITGLGRKPAMFGSRIVALATTDADATADSFARVVLHYDIASDTLGTAVSTSDAVPDGTGNFQHFDTLSSQSAGGAEIGPWFVGSASGSQRGVYLHDGTGLARIVDRTFDVPNGAQTKFVGLQNPRLVGDRLAFDGNDLGTAGGAYVVRIGETSAIKLVTKSVTMPDGVGSFTGVSLGDITADGDGTVSGFGTAPVGSSFDGPQRGIYRSTLGSALTLVANRNITIPGTELKFDALSGPLFDGDEIVFFGRGPSGDKLPLGSLQHKGLFTTSADGLVARVDTTQQMPGGEELFSEEAPDGLSADAMSIDAGALTFRGVGSTGSFVTRVGLYRQMGDTLSAIVDTDMTLGGQTVQTLEMGRSATANGRVVFYVGFADGTEAVYLASPVQ